MGQPRPNDWSSLGLSTDPVPGNVDQIRNSADRHFRKVADLIVDQAAKLRRIDSSSSEEWDSESGKAFREVANDLAGAIDKAEHRYREVGTALTSYATLLDGVQDEADRILGEANNAEAALRRARAIVIDAPHSTPEYDAEKKDRQEAIDDAKEALRIAQGEIEDLIGTGGAWHTANRAAADAIRAAIDDEMSDEWYDTVKQWIHDARAWLNSIKDILAIIGAILVLVAMFIPGVNLFVLAVIGVILALTTLLITSLQYFAGDATAEDVAWAAVDVVLSIVGLRMATMIDMNTLKMVNSTASSLGQTSRLAGGSYSAAYSAFRDIFAGKGFQYLDNLLEGGAALFTVARTGQWAPLATRVFVPTILAGLYQLATSGWTIKQGADVVVGGVQSGWDNYVDNLDRIQIGSI